MPSGIKLELISMREPAIHINTDNPSLTKEKITNIFQNYGTIRYISKYIYYDNQIKKAGFSVYFKKWFKNANSFRQNLLSGDTEHIIYDYKKQQSIEITAIKANKPVVKSPALESVPNTEQYFNGASNITASQFQTYINSSHTDTRGDARADTRGDARGGVAYDPFEILYR